MIFKKAILIPVFAAMVAGGFAVEKLNTLPRVVVPPVPLKFLGGAVIGTSPWQNRLVLGANVWRGGVRITDGTMSIVGHRATNRHEGYQADFDFPPHAGSPIVLTFRGAEAGAPLYTGTAATPPLITFITPGNGARIDLAGSGNLTFSWSGGNPPYQITITQEDGPRVFIATGIGGTSMLVPFSKFTAGNRYRVHLRDAHIRFVFDRPVEPSSNLTLSQLAQIMIYAI